MSSEPATNASGEPKPPARVKPHQLALVLGIAIGLFAVVSGILPQITGWENDNAIHRTVFVNIPGPIQIAFYTVIPVMIVWGAFMFANRMKNWERGAPAQRHTTSKNAAQRLKDFRAGAYMQTLLRDAGAGLMHSMIYFGFLVLLGVTTVLEVDHQLPESLKFLHGTTYKAYAFVGDLAGLVFLAGIVWAIIRRYVQRPYRIRIKSKPEHAAILGTFFAVGVTGFTAEMFRIALEDTPDYEKWAFIGYPLATLVDGWSVSNLETWHQWMWILHVASFVAFLALLPLTMLRHIFTSPLNMYLKDKDRPPASNEKSSKAAPPPRGDAFWSALSDMHPRSLGRRETIQRLTAQKDGLALALRQAQAAAAELPEHEAAFLGDNLIYQSAIMVQTCTWLEQVELAHEALDLGDRPALVAALAQAEAAFAQIPVLADGYCRGEWRNWYRGCKKLNVSATLKRNCGSLASSWQAPQICRITQESHLSASFTIPPGRLPPSFVCSPPGPWHDSQPTRARSSFARTRPPSGKPPGRP